MIFKTERQIAEKQTETIKEAIKNSQLNFHLSETPYSLKFFVKKKFINDFSRQISEDETPSTPCSPLNFSSQFESTKKFESSSIDSGVDISTTTKTEEDINDKLTENLKLITAAKDSEIKSVKNKNSDQLSEIKNLIIEI